MSINEYMALSLQLLSLRVKNKNKESPEEDALLDRMDKVWDNLTPEEIEEIRSKT